MLKAELVHLNEAFLNSLKEDHCSLLHEYVIVALGSDKADTEVKVRSSQPRDLKIAMATA